MRDWRKLVEYRNYVEVLRAIAAATEEMDHRQSLIRVADYYEKAAGVLVQAAAKENG